MVSSFKGYRGVGKTHFIRIGGQRQAAGPAARTPQEFPLSGLERRPIFG